MHIQLTAELSEVAVAQLLSEFLPVTVDLDPLGGDGGGRWIRIEQPDSVDFVPDLGLRVRTSATVRWTALGLGVPATVRDAQLLITPEVDADERGPRLVFRPTVEKADFKLLPGFVDQAIASRINRALAAEASLIGWHFGETLTQRLPLPSNLIPLDALHLAAGDLAVTVGEHGMTIGLHLAVSFSRGRPELSPDAQSPGAPQS